MEFRFSLLFTFVSFYLEYSHTAWLEIEFSMMVKNPPTVQETRVQSLHWEDPLEEGMATHSSILAWRIPWTEEPGRLLQSMGPQTVKHD